MCAGLGSRRAVFAVEKGQPTKRRPERNVSNVRRRGMSWRQPSSAARHARTCQPQTSGSAPTPLAHAWVRGGAAKVIPIDFLSILTQTWAGVVSQGALVVASLQTCPCLSRSRVDPAQPHSHSCDAGCGRMIHLYPKATEINCASHVLGRLPTALPGHPDFVQKLSKGCRTVVRIRPEIDQFWPLFVQQSVASWRTQQSG